MDGARSARLLFAPELSTGVVHDPDFDTRQVRAVTKVRRVPVRPVRVAQQVAYKLGRLGYERQVVAPLTAARRSVLGERAVGPPRFLVRVDEFPHYRAWDDPKRFGTACFERFHEILSAAGVPYLLAVLPRVSHEPLVPDDNGDARPLDDEELSMLARLGHERVSFALHGHTHRTLFASPRRHSELCGLSLKATGELLDAGLAELAQAGLSSEIFVPPYNRFDATQLRSLAQRFRVVCGGPESIGQMGFQRTPQWRGETVYLPSYAPFYGHAAEVMPAVERAIDAHWGLWVPVVLHWGWEADADWTDLERLVRVLAPHATVWGDFLAAIGHSKEGEFGRSTERSHASNPSSSEREARR